MTLELVGARPSPERLALVEMRGLASAVGALWEELRERTGLTNREVGAFVKEFLESPDERFFEVQHFADLRSRWNRLTALYPEQHKQLRIQEQAVYFLCCVYLGDPPPPDRTAA